MLKAMDEGKVVLNFNLKTKLDNPEFGLGVIQKALEEKISRSRRESGTMKMIQLPGKILEGTFSSAAGLTKTVINGTVSVGQEIKRAVESSFTKGSDNAPVANATAVNTTE